ncbi:hypothetical protein G3M81_23250 [Bacillus paralicheniformis]|uniref:hypothetical protein n=1 Tax=Bacillus TaxID=1386 RepID=UPI0013EEE7DB|nr:MULTISPECIES: hypothetical protein [Bacillus]QII26913.1 hypothetical protein G3M80_20665 [Bacillus altitudinis]QII51478.1 hypothetical protein G3M81_23250 [Bacillus paralicheniformis]
MMQFILSMEQCILLVFTIFLFAKSAFKKEILYLIMGIGALSCYFGIKALLNDQFIIAILFCLAALSLGFYCENKVRKELLN